MSQASAPVSVPKLAIDETGDERTITFNNWKITATKKSIVTASEGDELQKKLGFPLPEMTFGSNGLTLIHTPSQIKYMFNTPVALERVKNGELGPGDGAVKVGYADEWLKSRYVMHIYFIIMSERAN